MARSDSLIHPTRPALAGILALGAVAAFVAGAEAQEVPAGAGGGSGSAVTVAGPKPDLRSMAVLDDGTVVAGGAVSETSTDVVVTAENGSDRSYPKDRVSLALADGKRIHRGDEEGVRAAWLAWLKATHADRVPTRKLADADPAAKAAWWTDVLAAADRCAKWKMPYAALALLAEGLDLGTWDDAAETRALEWEPTAFPFSPEDAERAKLSAAWAREIVPLGGEWVLRGDVTDGKTRSQLWTQESIALRTRNLLIFSLDRDPKVVGSLLRQGERTVRDLEKLFGKPELARPDPLEIRLFRDRKEYLIEGDGGGKAPVWSGGFFSPGEMVSRFYVERDSKSGRFLEGELHEVLSHELTHHWIEMRFCAGEAFSGVGDVPESAEQKGAGGRKLDQPGHWIVEGVARFIEDQAVLPRRPSFAFDDPGGECVRDAAAEWRAGIGIPIEKYLEITPKSFRFLGDGPKQGKGGLVNSERGVFYDQGGALSFFMMNKRGSDGRTRFIQYLKDVYGGRMEAQSWTRLGFASAQELENEFAAFLKTVK